MFFDVVPFGAPFMDRGKVPHCPGTGTKFKSSWFGFSLLLRDPSAGSRSQLVRELMEAGFEVRPIVTGNFVNNEVMKYFNYSIHSELKNADYIDQHVLFVGNHHYGVIDAINTLAAL